MTTPAYVISFPPTYGTATTAALVDDIGPSRTVNVEVSNAGIAWFAETAPVAGGPWSLFLSGTGDFRQDFSSCTFRYIRVTRVPGQGAVDPTAPAWLVIQAQPAANAAPAVLPNVCGSGSNQGVAAGDMIAGSASYPIAHAYAVFSESVAASDTDYYRIRLYYYTALGATLIADFTTRTAGSGGTGNIAANTRVAVTALVAEVPAGAWLSSQLTTTGSPADTFGGLGLYLANT